MTPEREAEIRQAIDYDLFAELPVEVAIDLLAALDAERGKVRRREATMARVGELLDAANERNAKLEEHNATLLGLINRMGDLFKRALRRETAALLREDFKKELPFFEDLVDLDGKS